MALRFIDSSWRDDLVNDGQNEMRFYIDPRRKIYPPIGLSSTKWEPWTSDINGPGSFYLSSGNMKYLIPMQDEQIIDILFIPRARWGSAIDRYLIEREEPGTQEGISVYWDDSDNRYKVRFNDGTDLYFMQSDPYTTEETWRVWTRLTVSINLNGSQDSCSLYVNGTSTDTTWDSSPTSRVKSYPIMRVNANTNGDAGLFAIAYIRLFPGISIDEENYIADDVQNNFKNIETEEIFWPLDGHTIGRTRCNITKRVTRFSTSRSAKKRESGEFGANTARLVLNSLNGQFSDDQYAEFDPENGVYNGLVTDRYLRERVPVWIETWKGI